VAEWSERLGGRDDAGDAPDGGGEPAASGVGRATPVIATSSATGAGLQELAGVLLRMVPVEAHPSAEVPTRSIAGSLAEPEQLAEHMVFRPAERSGFSVERVGEHAFAVRGVAVERLLQRFDVDNDDAMAYVEGRLQRLGVIRALEAQGFQAGDELRIGDLALELDSAG
jgi:GTP-binding protein